MGRELKRVPLDFKWPMNQIWKGYLNPFSSQPCKSCDSTGLNPATKRLDDLWYNFDNPRYINLPNGRRYNDNAWQHHLTEVEVAALIEAGRLMDFTRVPINDEQREIVKQKIADGGNSWLPFDNGCMPTPQDVNEWNKKGMGHDGINRWICVKARAKNLGVYGECEVCNGDGEIWQSEEIKQLAENWKEIEPPAGEGYQLWENTSEGSPTSPVFKSLYELCAWCEINATTFGSSKTTKSEWMRMLNDDHVYHSEGNMIFL